MLTRHIVIYVLPSLTKFFFTLNGTIFEKKKDIDHEMCLFFIFSASSVWNISHSKKKWARYDHKCIFGFM